MALEIEKINIEYTYPMLANIQDEPHRVLIIDSIHNAVEINLEDNTVKNYGKIKDLFKNEMEIYNIWPIGSTMTFLQEYKTK